MIKPTVSIILVAAFLILFPVSLSAGEGETEPDAYILLPEGSDYEGWNTLSDTYEDETGIWVETIIAEEDYRIALQKYMARNKPPAAFVVLTEKDAFIWEGFLEELRDTKLDEALRFTSLYLFYGGKAVGIPIDASDERTYLGMNSFTSESDKAAAEKFLVYALSGEEGQTILKEAKLQKLYH